MNIVTENIQQYIKKLIENKYNIQPEHEQFLGHHYNEMLDYPDFIQKIHIKNHYNILEIAIEHDLHNELNYGKLITLIINQLESGKLEANALLLLINPTKLKREDLYKLTKCKNVDNSFFQIPSLFIFETIEDQLKQQQNSINVLQQTLFEGFSQLKNACDMISSIKEELSSKIDQNKEPFDNEIRNIKDQISKSIDDNKSIQLISTKVDKYELLVKSELLDIKNQFLIMLTGNRNEMKSDIDKARQELSDNINDAKNHINSEIKQFEKRISNKIDDNKHSIEAESQKINNLFPKKVNECTNSILNDIKSVKSQISTSFKDTKDTIHSEIGNAQKSIVSDISKINHQLSQSIKNGQDLIKNDITSLSNSIYTKVNEKITATANNEIKSITTVINNTKKEITSNIIENQNLLSASINNVNDNIPIIIDNQQKILELSNKLNAIKTSICSDIKDTKNQLSNKIDDYKSDIESKIESCESSNNSKIDEETEILTEKIQFVSNFVTFKEILPIQFKFDKDDYNYNGLFNFCFSKIGNPFESRVIDITGNSEEGYEDALKYICDKNNEKNWKSKDSKTSYIKFDFKNKKFFFEGMQIKNHSESCGTMKDVLLDGSNDDSNWTTIQSWDNMDECMPSSNSGCAAWTYNTSHPNGFYRYLRLKINGLNTSNNYRLALKRIELYGTYQ